MKKTLLLSVMLLSLCASMSALSPIRVRINGENFAFIHSEKVPESMNEKFLKGVYCGTTSDFKDVEVFITQFKAFENYTSTVLEVLGDYYVVTYKPEGGIIDGALLLKKNDIEMAVDYTNPRGNRMRAKSPTIDLDLDKVSVTRNFLTQVNANEMGGPIITEDGSVTMVYAIDQTGKISAPTTTEHSTWIEAENSSVPGNRGGKTVSERNRCRTLGPGMNVISFYTQPLSKETEATARRLETLLKEFDGMQSSAKTELEVMGAVTCLVDLRSAQRGMILRNPKLWLTWLNKNPKSQSMEALTESLDDEDFKRELLKEVKSLKNKKLRRAWLKRLK